MLVSPQSSCALSLPMNGRGSVRGYLWRCGLCWVSVQCARGYSLEQCFQETATSLAASAWTVLFGLRGPTVAVRQSPRLVQKRELKTRARKGRHARRAQLMVGVQRRAETDDGNRCVETDPEHRPDEGIGLGGERGGGGSSCRSHSINSASQHTTLGTGYFS